MQGSKIVKVKLGRRWWIKGWKSFTTITVEKGKVVSAWHDKFGEDGRFASGDKDYNARMKAKSGSSPAEYTVKLVEDYLAKKDIDKVDTVVGATSNSNIFRTQIKFLLKKAEKGQTGKFVYSK